MPTTKSSVIINSMIITRNKAPIRYIIHSGAVRVWAGAGGGGGSGGISGEVMVSGIIGPGSRDIAGVVGCGGFGGVTEDAGGSGAASGIGRGSDSVVKELTELQAL